MSIMAERNCPMTTICLERIMNFCYNKADAMYSIAVTSCAGADL